MTPFRGINLKPAIPGQLGLLRFHTKKNQRPGGFSALQVFRCASSGAVSFRIGPKSQTVEAKAAQPQPTRTWPPACVSRLFRVELRSVCSSYMDLVSCKITRYSCQVSTSDISWPAEYSTPYKSIYNKSIPFWPTHTHTRIEFSSKFPCNLNRLQYWGKPSPPKKWLFIWCPRKLHKTKRERKTQRI